MIEKQQISFQYKIQISCYKIQKLQNFESNKKEREKQRQIKQNMRIQSKQRSTPKGISLNNKAASKNNQSSLPKLTISLQNRQYTLPINMNSTIQKLGLQLMLMIYDELLQQQLSEEAKQIHTKICQILLQSVNQVIKQESNFKNKSFLIKMVQKYQQSINDNSIDFSQQQFNHPNKYFINNYFQTSSDYESQDNQSFSSNSASKTSFKLYQKGKKSIEKRKKLQKQNAQLKSKVQISYCTFHPNISKSQKKIKSKESSDVFNRLYTYADELKIKNFFRRKQIEDQQEKINLSFKFVPQINPCSKQIMKLKQQQDNQDTSAFEDLNKSQVSFQASQNSSYKYLKDQSSKKVFQKLYDSGFYENRLNKTIQKITQEKQNQYSFHPQLSAGTKRMTRNLPNLQSRLKLYAIRKTQNSQSGYFSKSKDMKKDKSKSFIEPLKNQSYQSNQKKGVKKMLATAKNTNDQNQIYYKKGQQKVSNRINSEIFRVNTQFFGDDQEFQVTPKKSNIRPLSENFYIQNQQQMKKVRNQDKDQSTKKNKIPDNNIQNSRQLQNKGKIFQRIFIYLSQGESQLTIDKIRSNKGIPVEIIKILMPLLKELAQMQTQLDQQEFVWSLENLYQQLSIEMKAILLSWGLKLFKQNQQDIKSKNNLKHVKTDGSVFQLFQ